MHVLLAAVQTASTRCMPSKAGCSCSDSHLHSSFRTLQPRPAGLPAAPAAASASFSAQAAVVAGAAALAGCWASPCNVEASISVLKSSRGRSASWVAGRRNCRLLLNDWELQELLIITGCGAEPAMGSMVDVTCNLTTTTVLEGDRWSAHARRVRARATHAAHTCARHGVPDAACAVRRPGRSVGVKGREAVDGMDGCQHQRQCASGGDGPTSAGDGCLMGGWPGALLTPWLSRRWARWPASWW